MSIKDMSDREIVTELSSDSLLNRVRKLISSSAGEIEQACAQRRTSLVQLRRMEFAAAEKIIALVKAEEDMAPVPTMYACGYEERDNEFGMFAGPTPSLRLILGETVEGDDGNQVTAYVLKLMADRDPEKIARWNYETSMWDTIETQEITE